MARNVVVGERVFVPVQLLPNPNNYGTALVSRTVAAVQDRSAILNLTQGVQSDPVAFSRLHRNLQVLVLRVGDFVSEAPTLDPLAKSVLHFLRLFLDDTFVRLLEVRALDELAAWWNENAAAYSHVVLVGHSDANGLLFGVGGVKTAAEIGAALNVPLDRKLTFLSLACQSGRATFSQPFSNLNICEAIIAPFHSVHGVIASQFCQSFFAQHLLQGHALAVAHRYARDSTPGSTSFRMWRAGAMD